MSGWDSVVGSAVGLSRSGNGHHAMLATPLSDFCREFRYRRRDAPGIGPRGLRRKSRFMILESALCVTGTVM
jgi:hypothetical protein